MRYAYAYTYIYVYTSMALGALARAMGGPIGSYPLGACPARASPSCVRRYGRILHLRVHIRMPTYTFLAKPHVYSSIRKSSLVSDHCAAFMQYC